MAQVSRSTETYIQASASVQVVLNDSRELVQKSIDPEIESSHAVVGGRIENLTKRTLVYRTSMDWSGYSKKLYRRYIAKRRSAELMHSSGSGDRPSTGAVVYTMDNPDGPDCAFLVAWSVPAQNCAHLNKNKVYAKCGPIDDFIYINWSEIKSKLDACNGSAILCKDEATESEAHAAITDGHHAGLVASFKLTD